MSRPQKNTVDYFPHDADCCSRDTLKILQGKYGNDGYTFWFKLLEKLCMTDNHIIDCRNPVKWELIPVETRVSNEIAEDIMLLLCKLDAIDSELWLNHRVVWCQNLVDRIADAYKNRRREVPEKPVITDRNPISTDENPQGAVVSTVENPQTKLKETKLKETKLIYGQFKNVLLTEDEYTKLKEKFNHSLEDMIENLSEGIASKGYKYKSHYATLLSWDRREKKTKPQKGYDPVWDQKIT